MIVANELIRLNIGDNDRYIISIKNEDNTWSVSFIQMNGVAINEGRYITGEEANSIKEKEVTKILDIKE